MTTEHEGHDTMTSTDQRTATISVCVDCMFVHANGETTGTPDREPLGLIGPGETVSLGMMLNEHAETCPRRIADEAGERSEEECECDQLGFSWSSCDGCGSTLGGDRYAMTVFYAPEPFDGRPIGEAYNDPRVPCCGRDAADCDCETDDGAQIAGDYFAGVIDIMGPELS